MYNHISDAIKEPKIIKLKDNLYIARFETMKVYSTLYAIKKLLNKGVINENTVLIDSSSGIYAYALALACHKYKLKCHIIVSNNIDKSTRIQLELLGATIESVTVKSDNYRFNQESRVNLVKKRLSENNNYYWMQQYHDDIHYGGYKEFADLVNKEIPCTELTVVGGVGSGCSTGATAKFLRAKGISVNLCGLQPFGSITFGSEGIDDDKTVWVSGIGTKIDFLNVKHNNYDYIHWLSFDCCLNGTIELMKKYAIFAGLSSGGSYCIANNEVTKNNKIPCLIIAPDTGHRYIESVFEHNNRYKPISNFSPKEIFKASELNPPWSMFHWNKKNKEALKSFKEISVN